MERLCGLGNPVDSEESGGFRRRSGLSKPASRRLRRREVSPAENQEVSRVGGGAWQLGMGKLGAQARVCEVTQGKESRGLGAWCPESSAASERPWAPWAP